MDTGTDLRWYSTLPAPGPGPSVRWASAAFAAELRDWVAEVLGAEGVDVVALEQVLLRPWSTVWRARGSDGVDYWAKQNCEHQKFEARLLQALDELSPDKVIPVVGIDGDRGLHLVPDQGHVLSETIAADDVDAWCGVVAHAMSLQRDLTGAEDRLVAAGVTTMRTADAADYVAVRTEQLNDLPVGDPRRLSDDEASALKALAPTVTGWVERLAAIDLPESLVHNDLHANNVFATPDGRLRFFDFGDAVLAHPLSALMIPLNILVHRFEAANDDARLRKVADAGLEVWSDVVPSTELRSALPAALQLGRLGRAESWLRVCATLTDEELAEYGDAAPYWLGSLRSEPILA
ncbi:MAG TPA: aminoglycoside phosphotransferase family protein [Intrasporangium sp.]|uniref:aminoglycoside phosphotransferase family protein n=1 Tax=Intrasporangium sp. TaxID=1925024 RepID=UPI002B482D6B|nr:aminoglycoside phosphotransferase family protein [Intrasporangium sp.]HKX68595.1 aminoglycoside phosphotransferase family protein [Intrasporangium sp.]